MVEHESSTGGKMPGIDAGASLVFHTGESVALGERCSLRRLPALAAQRLLEAGYTNVEARLDGDMLRVEGLAKRSLTASVRSLARVKSKSGPALPGGTTLTLSTGTSLELDLPGMPPIDTGLPTAGIASSVSAQLSKQGYQAVHVELAGSTLLVEANLPAERGTTPDLFPSAPPNSATAPLGYGLHAEAANATPAPTKQPPPGATTRSGDAHSKPAARDDRHKPTAAKAAVGKTPAASKGGSTAAALSAAPNATAAAVSIWRQGRGR